VKNPGLRRELTQLGAQLVEPRQPGTVTRGGLAEHLEIVTNITCGGPLQLRYRMYDFDASHQTSGRNFVSLGVT